ncbi:MAG: methionyl-tRNA formyltransferase, partial [Dehalococcoidia bacterium]|nr:methionyl-tRNA formyltransferase [Dehalococcoidia bacterium]
DGQIDWTQDAVNIEQRIRAFHPWPGTFTTWNKKILKVIEAQSSGASTSDYAPGSVIQTDDRRPEVVTGNGALTLGTIQLEGRKAVAASEFILGYQDFMGSRLGS